MRKIIIKFFIALFLFTALAELYFWVFGYNQYTSKLFEWIKNSSNGHIVLIIAIGLIALKIGVVLGSLSKKKLKIRKAEAGIVTSDRIFQEEHYDFGRWFIKYGSSIILPMIALGILAGGIYLFINQDVSSYSMDECLINGYNWYDEGCKIKEQEILIEDEILIEIDAEKIKEGIDEKKEINYSNIEKNCINAIRAKYYPKYENIYDAYGYNIGCSDEGIDSGICECVIFKHNGEEKPPKFEKEINFSLP